MLGDVNTLLKTIGLLTRPSNVLSLHLKQTFPPIIWIFTEGKGDGIKFRLPFKIFSTLPELFFWILCLNFDETLDLYFKIRSYQVILNCLVTMSDLTNESDMVLIKHFCLACNVYVTHIVQCTDLAFSITQFMKLIRLLFCQNYGKIWRKKVSYN